MTFSKLETLIKKYNIPKNVVLMSDSGWECWETDMNGVYYSKKLNTIIFTQDFDIGGYRYNNSEWIKLTHEDKGE